MHVQDTTKGPVKVYVGPMVVNQTGQEQPVVYDADRRQFTHSDLQGARRKSVFVPEDSYCSLDNPCVNEAGGLIFPNEGQCSNPMTLSHGEQVNVPGPTQFALWPGQSATVVSGHRLRSNQYLLVEVVNGPKAARFWEHATVETAAGEDTTEEVADKLMFRTGELIIIKGTEAGFFIPCTGVRVVPDGRSYVRDAMTLEQLEFSILVDENGEKRYERGPQVVFPEPTEVFWEDDNGNKKFRAYELSKISALYVKVIAPYKDENNVEHAAGEELFITGETTPIYFPRPEHAIVKYGESELHYATAVPKGEGRYVLDRLNGEIATERGPQMLLPDARTHVIVRRILSDKQCNLWFPGSTKAAQHNAALRRAAGSDEIGYVESATSGSLGASYAMDAGHEDMLGATKGFAMRSSRVKAAPAAMADQIKRGTSYTPPRSVTLDTTMDGAVCIQVWTGFAVMVVGKDGQRKPVIGPETVLLDYDQTLEVLRLSTGKPKNTDNLAETVYLNVSNNKVSDVITVHTRDQVEVRIKVSFHVDFTGDPNKWFNVENYVKLLCDRVRSMLKGVVRGVDIEPFFANHVSIVRDTVLGAHDPEKGGRPGMLFEANGMKVIDVDVLGFDIPDSSVAHDLIMAQRNALRTSLKLQNRQREVEAEERMESLERQLAQAKTDTLSLRSALAGKLVADEAALAAQRRTEEQLAAKGTHELSLIKQNTKDMETDRSLDREKAIHDEQLRYERGEMEVRSEAEERESKAFVGKMNSVSDRLAHALEGAARASALDLVAKEGVRLGQLTGTPVSETLRRGLGHGLGETVEQLIEDFAATFAGNGRD